MEPEVERYTNGQVVVWAEEVDGRIVVCPDGGEDFELAVERFPFERVGHSVCLSVTGESHFSLDMESVAA
uniref:Uncharacterized protein n=1 Tax=viral metagenome TaxID=1070528 RepID=A0A6H2A1L2_9ZZZZ